MTNRLDITLTDEQVSRLERIAFAKEETLVATVQEAVTRYLDKDAEYRAYVQEGIDDFAAGRFRPWKAVAADLRAKFGDIDD